MSFVPLEQEERKEEESEIETNSLSPRARRAKKRFWTGLFVASIAYSYFRDWNEETILSYVAASVLPITFLYGIVYKYYALFDRKCPQTNEDWTLIQSEKIRFVLWALYFAFLSVLPLALMKFSGRLPFGD